MKKHWVDKRPAESIACRASRCAEMARPVWNATTVKKYRGEGGEVEVKEQTFKCFKRHRFVLTWTETSLC